MAKGSPTSATIGTIETDAGKRAAFRAILCGVAALAIAPSNASAVEVEGVVFPQKLRIQDRELTLQGAGLLRYRVVFRAYAAALYSSLGDEEAGPDADGRAKRLELEYFWPIDGEAFGPAADEILARNFDAVTLDPLRERIVALHESYRDVEPGDRYSLTYLPGRGTELALNGVPLTTVPGDDFADAYFAIWLGEEPLDSKLRDRLLGRR